MLIFDKFLQFFLICGDKFFWNRPIDQIILDVFPRELDFAVNLCHSIIVINLAANDGQNIDRRSTIDFLREVPRRHGSIEMLFELGASLSPRVHLRSWSCEALRLYRHIRSFSHNKRLFCGTGPAIPTKGLALRSLGTITDQVMRLALAGRAVRVLGVTLSHLTDTEAQRLVFSLDRVLEKLLCWAVNCCYLALVMPFVRPEQLNRRRGV